MLGCPHQRYGKPTWILYSNCKSEWTAFDAVEPGQLPESVARSVIKTTVSLPSCQQAQSTRWQCRRSLTRSVSEEMPYFTGLTVTRNPAWNARKNTSCHGELCSIACELTVGACEVARHPPRRSRSRRRAGRHTKLTVKRPRQQPLAQPRKRRAKGLAL